MAPKAAAALAVLALAFWAGRSTAPLENQGSPLAASQVSPAVAELWTSWLQGNRPPVICFSSPLSGIVKQFTTPLPDDSVPLRYSLTNQLERAFRQELGLSDEGYLYITPGTDEVKSGEARGAVRLADLFARSGLTARTTRAHLLDWDDFRQDNLILMGHNEQNQWIDPLLEPYPLQLQSTEGGRQRRIVNTDPRPGEPEFFEIHYPAQGSEVTLEYALVSMLSSPDGLHELLLLSGLNTQATLMGIEFLTTKERVEDLLQRLKSEQPERSAPWKFQLVLSADVRDQTPTRGSVELIRIID